jgi:hypothetical protein
MDKLLVDKVQGKRSVGIIKCRWENNIKIGLREITCDSVALIPLA